MKSKSTKSIDNKNDAKAADAAKPETKKAPKAPAVKPMSERHVARWNALTRRAFGHGIAKSIAALIDKGQTPQIALDGKSLNVVALDA
jgi:hypothetical protein